ncbi:ATP-binding protein [uncultured Psychroserpens sp.]|uniref:ATP-binding protein n=1 Tax=uncultured Psychroserpens sp. TaxID=255436 RepID=UPI00261D2702|nr:ATP-binding protein [uncultured Psychroserpens sp.]
MKNELQFKVSSALKDIIGKDLITDDYIAVFELVKNSFDAYATRVDITFENIYTDNACIIIKDDGKGMNYQDLINKWLFVAYSAKKEGTEDESFDYRDNIYTKRPFAGAKGIGRFSCDRLGKSLFLETTKKEKNPKTEVLLTEWEKFESNLRTEFVDISVEHETIDSSNYGINHGTILIIENLRSDWNRDKLITLKNSLAKLINPLNDRKDKDFKIFLHVPEEIDEDSNYSEYYDKINGEIQNFIFETLGLKTTKIISEISEDGNFITTKLFDGGTLIYNVKEKNKEFPLLKDIDFTIYYLNQSAKLTFAKRMGLSSKDYGHIFLYKNGFRIYPFGEPGEDPLKLDARKAQGYNRFLGTREIMGQVNISYETEELKETSSRGDGLKKTPTYDELVLCFYSVIRKLEKYVVNVQQWGLSIEDNYGYDINSRISDLLEKLTDSEDIVSFDVPDNFLDILNASQVDSAESIVKNLQKIAFESENDKLIGKVNDAVEKLSDIRKAQEQAEKQAEVELKKAQKATAKLKEQISENLFLKSINSQDFEEVISLLHHIGIYAGTIDANLKGISLRVQNNIELTHEELLNIIRLLSFETKKILNIASFATKANFKLDAEYVIKDLNNYVREYIQNIIPTVTDKSLKIELEQYINKDFITKYKPIEINIILDNIINNAKKANASNLVIMLIENEEGNFVIRFEDDGLGIKDEHFPKLYDLGFTTTDGSGIGLNHVRKIMKSMKGSVKAENNSKGATFILEFKKYESN